MWIDHSHGDKKAVVGNAVEADPAVVVRNMFYEPVDRVVGVRAFVDAFRVARIVQGAKHDELTLGTITAANILKHEDVTIGNHVRVTINHVADALAWAGDAVGSPIHENRQRG